ncbi:hypothetical protein FCOIX_10644 [Fusarium coicis]|nr:hypothetical protein FCOIX_10644 [Fusarium coicis]
MTKPALDHIPAEILVNICWHLCSHCANDHLSHYPQPNSFRTPDPGELWEGSSAEVNTGLPSLARTCRVLNSVATPYIYHNIDAKRWSEQKINEFLKDRRQLHKRRFIRRLTYELDPFPLYTLLYRMPDLELLCLVDRGTFGQTLASGGQKKLHNLRYLHLERGTSSGSTRNLITLENLFEMAPNIKTLVINSGVLKWKAKLGDSPKVPLANLTCLKLYDVSAKQRTVKDILDNCGPLESFIYVGQRVGCVTPWGLELALNRSSSTLRHLECCWHSLDGAPLAYSLIRSLKAFEKLETLVLGGGSLAIGVFGEGTSHINELDPTSLVELLPASIVEIQIDSKRVHKGLYQPMVALCQAKQAGSFPKLRSFLQSNFDVSQVPYTLGDLSELSERYGVSFKQEARSVFAPPAARPPSSFIGCAARI